MDAKNVKFMSDEELGKAIEKKYGPDWTPETVDYKDPLIVEFLDRISRGKE